MNSSTDSAGRLFDGTQPRNRGIRSCGSPLLGLILFAAVVVLLMLIG
jgi:hypothetical protein